MEQLFFFVIALSLDILVGCIGKKRKIGFWMAFWLSALNIIIGKTSLDENQARFCFILL